MQNIVQQFHSYNIRIVQQGGQPWFILSDVCGALGVKQPTRVAARLDTDEVNLIHVTDTLGREQQAYAVNESGLYAVILRSDKPAAKEFRKWVTNEVLPSIRQTGSYSVQPAAAVDFSSLQKMVDLTAAAINASEQRVLIELDTRIQQFVDESPVNHSRAREIKDAIEVLAKKMGGKPQNYRTAWTAFKDRFQLAAYKDLPNNRFEEALKFIRDMTAAYDGTRLLGASA